MTTTEQEAEHDYECDDPSCFGCRYLCDDIRPDDLVPIEEAAVVVQLAIRVIKRMADAQRLKSFRESSGKLLVSPAEIRGYVAGADQRRKLLDERPCDAIDDCHNYGR